MPIKKKCHWLKRCPIKHPDRRKKMSVTLSNTNIYKSAMNLKREFPEFNSDEAQNKDQHDSNSSEGNSESSDLENNGPNEEATPLDYTGNALALHPVADLIKKEFLPEFDFNPFRNQNLAFKDGLQNRSPFLLPTQLYKTFLANLGKRRRSIADCYSLYPRNMFLANGLGLEASDDENGEADSADEVIRTNVKIFTPNPITFL